MHNKKLSHPKRGFTIIELLTVVSVVVVLIGILVPAIQGVKRIATNLEQKSLFHSLEIGLNLFKKDFGDYPESTSIDDPKYNMGGKVFTGAQHLAEAMVGRDGRGYNISQIRGWKSPEVTSVYHSSTINKRKPRYTNLKGTGAFVMSELYDSYFSSGIDTVYSDNPSTGQRAPVLTDVFQKKKIDFNNERIKVGTPVLYFRANTSAKLFDKNGRGYTSADGSRWKYNYEDNRDILEMPLFFDTTKTHQLPPTKFYQMINDETAPGASGRPYNEDTFILISAGYDGIFGTKDDITNFKN